MQSTARGIYKHTKKHFVLTTTAQEETNMLHQINSTTASSVEYETDNTTGDAASLMHIRNQMQLIQSSYFWLHIVIIPVGVVGNVLCLLVMSQKQNRSISCSVYMGALAIADTIQLLTRGFSALGFPEMSHFKDRTVTLTCKVLAYCLFTSSQCGVLIILALLTERVIAVCKPMKAAIILSSNRALIITSLIAAFAFLFNIPFIFTASAKKFTVAVRCASDATGKLGYIIHSVVGLLINGVLPLVSILIMNLMILYTIKSSKAAFGKQTKTKKYHKQIRERITNVSGTIDISEITNETMMTSRDIATFTSSAAGTTTSATSRNETRHNQSNLEADNTGKHTSASRCLASRSWSQKDRQLTVMTVAMTLVFLLCTVPFLVHVLVWRNVDYQSSAWRQIMFQLASCIVNSLGTLNCAINFYMYIFSLAQKFRSDLSMLFHCHSAIVA